MPLVPPSPAVQQRPLRGLERAQLAFGGACYADLIVAEIEGTVALDALVDAAHALATRHAVLRSSLPADMGDPVRVAATVEVLPVVFTGEPWLRAAERLLAEPLMGPSWRLVCALGPPGAARFHLLLAVHHALLDGRSLSILLADLLKALDHVEQAAEGPALGAPAAAGRAAADLLPRWMTPLAPLLRAGWRASLGRGGVLLDAAPLAADANIPTLFAALDIPEGPMSALCAAARAQGASVGGALASAAWAATVALSSRRGTPRRRAQRVPVEAMVDLRRYLPEAAATSAEQVGMYAGGVLALPASLDEPDAWERARFAMQRTRQQLKWSLPLLPHLMFDGLRDPAAWLAASGTDLGRHGGAAAVTHVSNVGPWALSARVGSRRILGVWSAAGAIRTGPALLLWLRTVEGRGCLSAVANGLVVSRGQLERFLEDAAAELDAMGRARPARPRLQAHEGGQRGAAAPGGAAAPIRARG